MKMAMTGRRSSAPWDADTMGTYRREPYDHGDGRAAQLGRCRRRPRRRRLAVPLLLRAILRDSRNAFALQHVFA